MRCWVPDSAASPLISIHAKKCRHCGSEIAAYTEVARDSLDELHHLMEELSKLHSRELRRHAETSRARPLRDRILLLLRDESFQRGIKALAPAALLVLSTLIAVRLTASGLVFGPRC